MSARRPHRTLKTAEDLVSAGLIAPERRKEAAAVAARYAIALTPAVGAPDRAGRFRRSDRPPIPARRARTHPPPGRGRRPDWRRAEEPASRSGPPLSRPRADQARSGLRGLLPLLLPPRNDRPRRAGAERGGIRRRARLCAGASADLGGGADRRRSARPVAAPPRRDDDRRWRRSRISRCCAGTPACRSPRRSA